MMIQFDRRSFLWLLLVVSVLILVAAQTGEAKHSSSSSHHKSHNKKQQEESSSSSNEETTGKPEESKDKEVEKDEKGDKGDEESDGVAGKPRAADVSGDESGSKDRDQHTSEDESSEEKSSSSSDKSEESSKKSSKSSSRSGLSKRPKKKQDIEDEASDEDEAEDDKGDETTEGESRSVGGVLSNSVPGWITQIRDDQSGNLASGCAGSRLLGFSFRIGSNLLIMHESTFTLLKRHRQGGPPGALGTAAESMFLASKTYAMSPIQQPVPAVINPNGMGAECMNHLSFDIEINKQGYSGFNIYKYKRENQVLGGRYAETYEIGKPDGSFTRNIDCKLYGWSQEVRRNDYRFSIMDLEEVSCTKFNRQCKFRIKPMGGICGTDIGLPIVCSGRAKYLVGPPLPANCVTLQSFTAYNLGAIMAGPGGPDRK